MVAYLKKPTGSEGFQDIVDFLNGSYIRFSFTKNPTIYVSLIEKFWQTATVRTVDNGEQEITVPVDGKEFTIMKKFVRRHLQLADVEDEAVYEEWDDRVERATTTAASLDAAQASGNITKTQSTAIPNVPFPQGIGAGGSPRCQKATWGSIAQTRSKRIIMKVKKLEKIVKSNQARRRAKIVVSDDEEDLEDSSKQGRMIEEIDQDAGITLVTPTKDTKNVHTYTRRRMAVSTGSSRVSTISILFSSAEESVSTAGASMPVSTAGIVQEVNISIPSSVVIKDKAAVRLQEELDEEERQRMARVHAAAQSFTKEEWENIRARVEADEELTQRLQAEERNKYSEVDQAKMLVDLINQRKRYFVAHKAEAKKNKPMI
ncbi:hypothetical protein Tco_0947052 [Tanacetum coccineum]